MILVLKPGAPEQQKQGVNQDTLKGMGLRIHESVGEGTTILGLVGDTSRIDSYIFSSYEIVKMSFVSASPLKRANRMFKPDDTVIDVCGRKIGQGYFVVISGPCSVESEEQIVGIARGA